MVTAFLILCPAIRRPKIETLIAASARRGAECEPRETASTLRLPGSDIAREVQFNDAVLELRFREKRETFSVFSALVKNTDSFPALIDGGFNFDVLGLKLAGIDRIEIGGEGLRLTPGRHGEACKRHENRVSVNSHPPIV